MCIRVVCLKKFVSFCKLVLDTMQITLNYLYRTVDVLKFVVTCCVLCFYYAVIACLPYSGMPKKSVEKNVVLVTGAGSGIGRLLSVKLAQLGARLVLWDINEEANEETADIIKKGSGEAYAYTVDLSDRQMIYK